MSWDKSSTADKRLRGRKAQERRRRLLSLNPLCVRCTEEGRVSVATELDHVVPLFKGGRDDESNLEGLCSGHHAAKTAADLGRRIKGCDESGWPLDPNHHWNR